MGWAPELDWEGGGRRGRARYRALGTGAGRAPRANGRLWGPRGASVWVTGPGWGLSRGVGEGSAVAGPWGSGRPLRRL